MDARFLSTRAKRGRFGARKTQIELNGRFYGLRTAFPQVVMGIKEFRHLNEKGSNQGKCRDVLPRAAM